MTQPATDPAALPQIRLYMDVNVHAAITEAMRRKGIDVLTAQEDGRRRDKDPTLLDRSTSLARTLVTVDEDFTAEAARRIDQAIPFAGVIYAHQLRVTIRQFIDDLELICVAAEPQYMMNRIEWIPLK